MAAPPLTPSTVAVRIDVPADFAVTTPVVEIVATALLPDVQITVRPDNGCPFASYGVAVA
jgi:hypothetical protein